MSYKFEYLVSTLRLGGTMSNLEQTRWLRSKLYMMRNQESKLFKVLIDDARTKEEIKSCVSAIIILSGYILRVSNAIKIIEENPSLVPNLDFLDSFKNKKKWR